MPGKRAATIGDIAEDAIALFIEYRDSYGYDEARARAQAVLDIVEGARADIDTMTAQIQELHDEQDDATPDPQLRGSWDSVEYQRREGLR